MILLLEQRNGGVKIIQLMMPLETMMTIMMTIMMAMKTMTTITLTMIAAQLVVVNHHHINDDRPEQTTVNKPPPPPRPHFTPKNLSPIQPSPSTPLFFKTIHF